MVVEEYLRPDGSSPFAAWFGTLDPQAAAKVTTALLRLELGNLSSLKATGGGLSECRIDWGPGYRLYLTQQGSVLILLFTGGTKRGQQRDIAQARALLEDYKARKGAAKPKGRR